MGRFFFGGGEEAGGATLGPLAGALEARVARFGGIVCWIVGVSGEA